MNLLSISTRNISIIRNNLVHEQFSQLKHAFKFYLRYNLGKVFHKPKMRRRTFLKNFPKGIIVGVAAAHVLRSYANSPVYGILTSEPGRKKDPNEILKEMYKEVKELGSYENDDFIKREFHVDLDGDWSNKEEHVVVLIQSVGDKEKMTLQVTYFQAKKSRFIKYAKDTKVVKCYIKGDEVEIKKCDYNKKEIKSLLPDILQGIRYKKKLLKLIDHKNKL